MVVIRPSDQGLQVLLTRRPATMAFAAGVHVFPGGRVDRADERHGNSLAGALTAAVAGQRLANTLSSSAALAHHVAAVRETMEETGISVEASDLIPLTRWITPPGLPRRFDVRFFAALVPEGTEVGHASGEVELAEWWTPRDALVAAAKGRLPMLLPTLVTLQQLVGATDASEIERIFRPGTEFGPPSVGMLSDGLALVDQRSAAGIPGRFAPGWLVGDHELVLIDPADPTGQTAAVVDAEVAKRGAHIVGIALSSMEPGSHAGAELYAAGRGLPVVARAGAGSVAPYPFTGLRAGEHLPFGDIRLVAVDPEVRGRSSAVAAARDRTSLAYKLPDGRLIPPASGSASAFDGEEGGV